MALLDISLNFDSEVNNILFFTSKAKATIKAFNIFMTLLVTVMASSCVNMKGFSLMGTIVLKR